MASGVTRLGALRLIASPCLLGFGDASCMWEAITVRVIVLALSAFQYLNTDNAQYTLSWLAALLGA